MLEADRFSVGGDYKITPLAQCLVDANPQSHLNHNNSHQVDGSYAELTATFSSIWNSVKVTSAGEEDHGELQR